MKLYPCKDCIVKGLCKELCYKTTTVKNLYKRIRDERCCPDCGNARGVTYNGEYLNVDETYLVIIECIECNSSFFPLSSISKILRNGKCRVVKKTNNLKYTSFGEYITNGS